MADTSHAPLRAQLQEERERLLAQLRKLGHGPDPDLTFDEGFADSSQVTAERGETEALVNKLADSLRDVEHALAKFDSDSYGVCEGCGQPIAPARLEARPEARLCINCAASAANRR